MLPVRSRSQHISALLCVCPVLLLQLLFLMVDISTREQGLSPSVLATILPTPRPSQHILDVMCFIPVPSLCQVLFLNLHKAFHP